MNKVQAIILCAGCGNRLKPLTENVPKCLIEIDDKTILEYKLELLDGLVDEVIIVIGYLGDKIIDMFGDSYKSLKLKYCEQKELLGTGHAVEQAKDLITADKFVVLNGDDIYSKSDIENLLKHDYAMLSKEIENPHNFGVLNVCEDQCLLEIIEKPTNPPTNLINIGCYVFNRKIFDKKLELSSRGEYEIIDYLTYLIDENEKIKVEKVNGIWLPINNLDELEIANRYIEKCAV